MELELRRFKTSTDTTLGRLYIDNLFICFTLEDGFNYPKIPTKTRIPKGRYKIEERQVLSPLTIKYRKGYDFFIWHLQLQDVPNFNYVYVHAGNDHTHTDGCILVGDNIDVINNVIWDSKEAFEYVYKKICTALTTEDVYITIKN